MGGFDPSVVRIAGRLPSRTCLHVVEQSPAGRFPLARPAADPIPEIIVTDGVATWAVEGGPYRFSNPADVGAIAAAFANAGYVRAANRFWDAELEMTAPPPEAA